jgi:hypothetical protein
VPKWERGTPAEEFDYREPLEIGGGDAAEIAAKVRCCLPGGE